MHNHQLIKQLKLLEKKEMTRFREFVYSPFHNKHKGVRKLVDYFEQHFPNFNEKKMETEALLRHFAEDKKFNKQKLALLFTYTIRLLKNFHVEIFLNEENKSIRNIFKLKSYRKRRLNYFYEKEVHKLRENTQDQGSEYHQHNFLLKSEINEYFSQYPTINNHQYLVDKQIQLDHFFITEKLKDACEMYLRHQILKVPFDLNFVDSILNEITRNTNFQNIPTILIYQNIYKLLINKKVEQYESVLGILNTNEHFLPKPELENIYNYLQNFCIQKINQGNRHFLSELFKIYQSQLSKELLFQNGYLPEFHYKNIVTTGLREKAFDWVLNFIEDYKKHLNSITAENAYSYNLANYYYATQQFSKVLSLLIRVEYTDVRYSLDAKTLLLRTYFELEEEEALLSLSDAFRQYLKRNFQISEDHKKGYFNLLKLTKKVFQLKMSKNYWKKEKVIKEWQKLKQEIESSKIVFNKNWLLEKITQIHSENEPKN